MTTVSRSAIVPYSAMEMFTLVNNVEDYPKFLPWCHASEILYRDEDVIEASLTLIKSGIKKSFATRNLLQPGKMIEIRLLSGPFHHLQGFWRFENQASQHSKVSLDLEFEFSNKLISLALSPLFIQVGDSLVEAFEKRANDIYGSK